MSVDAAKAFIEKANSDTAIQEKLDALKSRNNEEFLAAVTRIANDSGYVFEPGHIREALNANSELSDEQLDKVSAGNHWSRGLIQ